MNSAVWMALAMVLIIEGIGPMLFPTRWKNYLSTLTRVPESKLRRFGGAFVVAGLVIYYMVSR